MSDVKERTVAVLQRLVSFGLDMAELTGNKVSMTFMLTIEPVVPDDAADMDEADDEPDE